MPEVKDTRFGEYVRVMIERKGTSMNECARVLGISSSQMSNVVNGIVTSFSDQNLANLALFLELDDEETKILYNFEALVRGSIPRDVVHALLDNPTWVPFIRHISSFPIEEQSLLLASVYTETNTKRKGK